MSDRFLEVLEEELLPALGCTEPIAVAYAAAKAREVLGDFPEQIIAECSGNVIKNVKGVIVPTTGDMRGIETSAILGAVAGRADRKLEVLSRVLPEDIGQVRNLKEQGLCRVALVEGVENLFIRIRMRCGEISSSVTISESHTNIIEITRNEEMLFRKDEESADSKSRKDRSFLSLASIHDYVNRVDLEPLKPLLDRQITMNSAIAREGLKGGWGAEVGKTLLESDCGGSRPLETEATAWAAAGSDARMAGSIMPVVINSGSGNQGLTVSIPVIRYAREAGSDEELLYRALALSNLIAIYIKSGIGKLSAYCGAVSAAAGAGAGIAYLEGEGYKIIVDTVINTLANTSGILCDGAKASCAAKIATSVQAAFTAWRMARAGRVFPAGEGLVVADPDGTVANICRVAREGMRSTDLEILTIMTE